MYALIIGSPLEQFLIFPVLLGDNFGANLVFLVLLIVFSVKGGLINKTPITSLYEVFISAVQIKKVSCEHTICSVFGGWFLFIVLTLTVLNLLSVFPYVLALTGYLAVTFTLSAVYMVWLSLLFIFRYPVEFTALFLPSGAPLFILPLLVPIEIFSYLMRPLSLALRLFANITAGHMLLGILSFFLFKGLVITPTLVIPLTVIHCIGGLEVGVACLQVYV